MSLEFNDKAELLLTGQGFECAPIQGEIPDFLCKGKLGLWVEVKSLEEPDWAEDLAQAQHWLRERCSKVKTAGLADAYVSPDRSLCDERDIKIALGLAERALQHQGARSRHAVIPADPVYERFVTITVPSEDGEEVFYCCRSRSGRYGRPYSGYGFGLREPAVIVDEHGVTEQTSARELHLYDDNFRIAISVLPSDQGFRLRRVIPRGMAREITDVERVRRAATKANGQFKNACDQHADLPCLLIVFDDTGFGCEPASLGALYGDRQVIWPPDDQRLGRLHYGPNGFWNEKKNRTTSAACYVRGSARPLMVHNFWATHQLPTGLLDASEYVPQEDGTFRVFSASNIRSVFIGAMPSTTTTIIQCIASIPSEITPVTRYDCLFR